MINYKYETKNENQKSSKLDSLFLISTFKFMFFLNKGFTIIELLVALGIMSGIVFVIGAFGLDLFDFQIFLSDIFIMQQEINQTLLSMGVEIRGMGPSANGSYPIESASPASFTFYSDVDGDGAFERVRYFVAGNILRRGLIEPVGNPASYPTASESFKDMVHDVILPPTASASLFIYYDENYTGTQASLPVPIDVNRVRLLKATITADRTPQDPEGKFYYSSVMLMRNLRNNQ